MNPASFFAMAVLYTACAPTIPTKEPFAPTQGTWMADGFEVTENACNLNITDQTGETMNLTSSEDGFIFTFDENEPYACTLSNQDFECEEPSALVGESDPDSEFTMEISVRGSFSSNTELEITTGVSLRCEVEDCSESEEYFGAAFPCATQTRIEMSFIE